MDETRIKIDEPSKNDSRASLYPAGSLGWSTADNRDDSAGAGSLDVRDDRGGIQGNDLGQAESKGQASLRDRQPISTFDSAQKPVQVKSESHPVLELPVENKALIPACTGQPVQAKASCPPLIAWRQADGGIWLPRYFTAVPHLKYQWRAVDSDFKPVLETKTGWQIQWATTCPECKKRFRPVAGFITILHLERMKELPENEQQDIIADIIRQKFETGSVSGGHPKCFS